MENVDLLTRINQHYNSFSKGQKLLANYIIDNYDRAAFITASKMLWVMTDILRSSAPFRK